MPKARLNCKILVFALFVMLTASAILMPSLVFADATVQVTPSITNVNVGTVFNVNVTVTGVSNLYAWEFRVYFLNAIINCTSTTEGSFLSSVGSTAFLLNVTNNYNSTFGRVLAACTLLGPGKSASGSGVLATLTFNAMSNGSSNLDLQETKLSDINSQSIPNTAIGGRVRVGQGGAIHDLTIVNVVSLRKTVGKGYPDNITVTVLNSGDFTETFNATLRLNGTDIITKQSIVLSGAYVSIIFTWNTTSFANGVYNVSGYAWPVVNETNTADNTKIDGLVTVTLVGDINGDGSVDIYDAIQLASAFNSNPSSSNWNPNADLNSDGTVDIYDAITLANNFNKHL